MFKIGDLAKFCKVNAKTIRFYEKQGLLIPAHVDVWTNYRYYDFDSVERLNEILKLKNLGFSLKEIKNFSPEQIKQKALTLQKEVEKLNNNIKILSSYTIKGDLKMKKFVNDERVVGKWEKVGVTKSEEELKMGQVVDNGLFCYHNLYFLPEGEKYFIFGWTKDYLFLENEILKYKILDNYLLIDISTFNWGVNFVVYKKIDSKYYTAQEIAKIDDTNIPFVKDPEVEGFWEVFNLVKNIEDYKKIDFIRPDRFFNKSYNFSPNGTLYAINSRGHAAKLKYSKGFIINDEVVYKTVSKYWIKKDDDGEFLICEWKSGDYTWGGKVTSYYVFKKVK